MGIKRLSHAVYDTRYHLVWAPKYRKWVLRDQVREAAEELFKEILGSRDCEVLEMEIAKDHVHIFTSIPPKYSVPRIPHYIFQTEANNRPNSFAFSTADGSLISTPSSGATFGKRQEMNLQSSISAGFFH